MPILTGFLVRDLEARNFPIAFSAGKARERQATAILNALHMAFELKSRNRHRP